MTGHKRHRDKRKKVRRDGAISAETLKGKEQGRNVVIVDDDIAWIVRV